VVTKNCDDYAIKAVGSSEAHITNVAIRDLTVTRDAADWNAKTLIRMAYVDGGMIEGCSLTDFVYQAVTIASSTGVSVARCRFGPGTFSYVYASNSLVTVMDNMMDGEESIRIAEVYGVALSNCDGSIIARNTMRRIYSESNVVGVYCSEGSDVSIYENQIDDCVGGYLGTVGFAYGMYLTVSVLAENLGIQSNKITNLSSWARGDGAKAIVIEANVTRTLVVGTHAFNNGNLIDRGNCESATPPTITGQADDNNVNCTFARSADFAHNGTYGYKFTKTVAAGTQGLSFFHDHRESTTNYMAGLVA
jgi:hypothetical protein